MTQIGGTFRALANISPLRKARSGGGCRLLCFLPSVFPLIVSGRLVVPRDAAEATSLLAHEGLFRAGTAAPPVSTAFYLSVSGFSSTESDNQPPPK